MQTSISKRFTKYTPLRNLFTALLALSSLNHLALAQSPIQPLQNDPAIRQQLNRKNYEPSNTPNPNNLFPFGGHRGTVEHRTGSIRITNNQTTQLGGGVELQQLNYKGEIGFHTRFTNHGWEVHSPFDEHASKTGYGKGQSISDGYGPSSYAYTIKGTMVHPADGYEAPQGGGYPTPSKYGAHDRYNIKVSGQARRMVQKPLDLAYGAKAAWRNLQQTGSYAMSAAVLARQNRNETYQPNPDRSIFGDVYERARVLSNNIKGLAQTGTWLPEVAFNGAIGALQATAEANQYSWQHYQYQQDIKRQQNMDAKDLFWHLYNTSSQYEAEQHSKEPLQQVGRDISQAIHQAAENNPIAAAWAETALRLAPLKLMPKTPMPNVPAAVARSGADDFAGAVAARAAQQAAKKADAIKPSPNTTTRNSSDITFASGQQKYTDTMQDKQFTKLVNDIRENGIKNPVIDYVEINGEAYIVKGNNRVRAAEYLGKNKELKYNKVDFPVEGTNFKTPQDVLDASTQNLRPPKYRGKGRK